MPMPINPRSERPSTYIAQGRSNKDERARLSIQDQMLTIAMGGPLPEQQDPAALQRIVDVGCGTGGWLIEVARAYPGVKQLVGVDVSNTILEYAQRLAHEQHVADRVEFHCMDALCLLEFPDDHFDLVNQRLGSSFLRSWDWMKILQEYKRVVSPGGIVRITESDMVTESSSQAFVRFNEIVFQALDQAGHFLDHRPDGVTCELVHVLSQQGLQNIQTHAHQVEYRMGTPQGQRYFEDTRYATRTLQPFLHKWVRVPDDFESICRQMLDDMQQPNFFSIWRLLTVWGTAPE